MNKKRMATLMAMALVLASSATSLMGQRAAIAEEAKKDALLHVTDASFDKEVLKSATPVLVDFYADWCGPCRQMAPIVEEVSKDLKGKLKVVKMNTDENQKTATTYEITGIPALYLYKKGQVVEKVVGLTEKSELVSSIKKHL